MQCLAAVSLFFHSRCDSFRVLKLLIAALGPLLSAYAVSAKDWRWSLYEMIWVSAPILIIYFVLMPETSGPNILLRRAQRLRETTGSQRLKSQSEMDQAHLTVSGVAVDALIKPLEITIKDPAILFVQVYAAIVYGIYYSCRSSNFYLMKCTLLNLY